MPGKASAQAADTWEWDISQVQDCLKSTVGQAEEEAWEPLLTLAFLVAHLLQVLIL